MQLQKFCNLQIVPTYLVHLWNSNLFPNAIRGKINILCMQIAIPLPPNACLHAASRLWMFRVCVLAWRLLPRDRVGSVGTPASNIWSQLALLSGDLLKLSLSSKESWTIFLASRNCECALRPKFLLLFVVEAPNSPVVGGCSDEWMRLQHLRKGLQF